MPGPYRIAVVGFGVVGATASYLLARAGHDVSLFERAPVVGPVGAGILLQPSGQMILKQIGLLDKVAPRGEEIHELYALTHRGRTLIRLPYAGLHEGCCAYGVHRGDLFEVLYEAVLSQAIEIHLGHEMVSSRTEKDRVYLTDTLGREQGPFDFVVAADGSRSVLRGDGGLRRWVHEYAYGALWAVGQCAAVRNRLHQVVHGTRYLLGLLPMGDGRCSLFWSLHRGAKETLFQKGFEAWRRHVLDLCPLAEELFESVRGFDQVPFTTYQHVWMSRWHTDHCCYLGDAAHAMSPHLGQGINLALIDAFVFAKALAQAPDYRQAFRAYSRARARHLRYYAAVTFLLTPFFQSGGFIKGLGRDLALPLMPRVPWVRRQMLMTMAGVKRGFFGGSLSEQVGGQ